MAEGLGSQNQGRFQEVSSQGPELEEIMILLFCYPVFPLRTEFGLDALGSGGDTIRAIRELSYKGGNTRTGAALHHVSDHVFLPHLTRPGIPKVFSKLTMPPNVTPK